MWLSQPYKCLESLWCQIFDYLQIAKRYLCNILFWLWEMSEVHKFCADIFPIWVFVHIAYNHYGDMSTLTLGWHVCSDWVIMGTYLSTLLTVILETYLHWWSCHGDVSTLLQSLRIHVYRLYWGHCHKLDEQSVFPMFEKAQALW